MALQTLEGDLIPMRPAKETLTRYAVLLLGAAILSFGLFNVCLLYTSDAADEL